MGHADTATYSRLPLSVSTQLDSSEATPLSFQYKPDVKHSAPLSLSSYPPTPHKLRYFWHPNCMPLIASCIWERLKNPLSAHESLYIYFNS